ncbi:MAG: acetyl-CoA acetyltransferase [Acidimicrobiales bacterium]|jgi:acetyl-CoA acetyltransferase
MTLDLTDQAVVCGVGESDYGRRLGRSSIDLGADAIRAAVTDAGLTKNDVDGMVVTFGSPLGADADTLAFSLGLELRAYNQTWAHGRFTGSALQWAAMTVAAGLADVVACLAAVSFSGVRRLRVGGGGDREGAREGGGAHGEDPVYGMTSPGAGAALMAQKYFARYGATSEDLASVPRAFRRHATLNPLAMYQEPLTVDAYLAARYVAEPLRIFDYCQVNDGAACVLVTTPERAADLAHAPVYLGGMQGLPAGRHEFMWTHPGFGTAQQDEFDWHPGNQAVHAMAGTTPADIDAFFTYDAFSPLVWLALERWGFCGMGEAKDFTQNGRIELGGELPTNTNGGLLSEAHVMGWNHQIEIVRQLRGDCGPRQVEGAEVIQWGNVYGDSIIFHR